MALVKVESKNNDLYIDSPKFYECSCGESNLLDDILYYCNHKGCEVFIYCDECIEFEHKFSKKKNAYKKGHKLNRNELTCANELFTNVKHDKAMLKHGKQQLLKLHGQIVYNKIKPYIRGGTVAAVGTGIGATMGFESKAILSAGKSILYHGGHLVKHVLGGGGIMAAVVFGAELVKNTIEYRRGKICFQELGKRTAMSAVRNGSIWGAATGGAAFGAWIGTICAPGIGTAIGGCIGAFFGVIAGYFTAKGINKQIDNLWIIEETEKRKMELKEALNWFQFGNPKVVTDPDKFNQEILRQKYKKYVLVCHPDRPNGNKEDFIKLNYYYGILKALCEDVPKKNTDIVVEEINPKPKPIKNKK